MTLSLRNNFFRGGIIFASLSLAFIAVGGYLAFPAYPGLVDAMGFRSGGLFQKLIERIAAPSSYVPLVTIVAAAAYSLTCIIFIFHFFEKTQSPEILFFGLFVLSFSFEFTRLLLPLRAVYPFPSMYLLTASRLLLFGRYFGLFSLFAASIYAAGLDGQKQQTVFLIMILASMVISLNVPIDGLVWDSTLMLLSGYSSMFMIIDLGILAVTIATFLISAHLRGSKNYIFIGLGVLLAFTGKSILLSSDTWITPLPGLFILVLGTWFVCTRLHREYLWL